MKTYIISDIHLGSYNCQTDKLIDFLDNFDGGRLIINGDFFDNMEARLKKQHWKILSKIRKMSDDIDIVWIRGNHDVPNPELIAHLLGITIVQEYGFTDNDVKILCIHGDRWDDFISKYPKITKLADWFYKKVFQRVSGYTSKTFLRAVEKVKIGAKKYCKVKGFDLICCGHTHHAEKDGFYYNSGCWTKHNCSYLVVEQGKIHLGGF